MANETVSGFVPPEIKQQRKATADAEASKTPQQRCTEKGGFWDAARQTCLLADPALKEAAPAPAPQPTNVKLTEEERRRAEQTRDNIITDEFGNQRIQTPEDVARIRNETEVAVAQQEASSSGRLSASQGIQRNLEQEQLQQQLSKLGQIQGVVGSDEKVDLSQALTAGTVGEIPSILTTAGTFAVGGGVALGPVGAVGGAVLGTAIGIWRGTQKNIEAQQKGQVKSHVEKYNVALRGLRTTAMLATTYPGAAPQLVESFNQQKYLIHQAYADIKAETDEDIEKYIEDGTEILAKFDAVTDADTGLISIYELRLNLAITKGIPMDDLALALEEAEITQ